MGGMTPTTAPVAKPAGTMAWLYAVLSVVTAVVLWVVAYALRDVSFLLISLGVLVAAASAVVALIVGMVQRLSSDRAETVRLSRVTAVAVGVPVGLSVVGSIIGAAAFAVS